MRTFAALFLISHLYSWASARVLTVNLGNLHSTYSVDGTTLKDVTTLKVNGTTDTDIIGVRSYFADVESTNITFRGQKTMTYSAKQVASYPEAPLDREAVVDFSQNNNFNFALIFRLYTQKEAAESSQIKHEVYAVVKGVEKEIEWKALNPLPLVVTFVAPLGMDAPQMGLTVTKVSPGCAIDLFAGGEPSERGEGTYWLYTFREAYPKHFQFSPVRTFAATIAIPTGCSVTIAVKDIGDDFASQSVVVGDRSMGFVMSFGYPAPVDGSAVPQKPIDVTHVVDPKVENYTDTTIWFTVWNFDNGARNNPLAVSCSPNFTTNFRIRTQDMTWETSGSSIQVSYGALSPRGFFVLQFDTKSPGFVEPPTGSSSVIDAVASVLFVFLYTVAAQ